MKGMVPVLVGFGRALRDEGLAVGTGDVATCAAADVSCWNSTTSTASPLVTSRIPTVGLVSVASAIE